jgi:hypothetical protein
MSSRILSDSILTSETLNKLCPEQENLWFRLLVCADDYGCADARPVVVLARCFPLRIESLHPNQIAEWLQELAKLGLITLYQVDGKDYLQVSKWEQHQRIRYKHHKCPLPPVTASLSTVPDLLQPADCTRSTQLFDGCRNPCYVESILNPIHIESLTDSLSKHKSIKDASKR